MNINFFSAIGYTGYGVAGVNFLRQLYDKQHNVTLFPMGQINAENQEDAAACFKSFEKQEDYDKNAPCLKIWHQFDLGARIGTGKFFAFPFFELTDLTKKEIHHLNNTDHIIVTCEWAKKVLENNGINKTIDIVPLGVNVSLFDHTIKPSLKDPKKYVFMNIGKWEIRKGHDILVNLFNETFSEEDDVELWINGSSSEAAFSSQELEYWHSLYMNSKLKDKIKIFPRLNSQEEVAQLMSYADCGIFPSRAEGWNLELLEMMAMNKPVITTNYSAHTAFCNEKNSFLVEITDLELANDNKYFRNFGKWAKIGNKEIDQFKEFMRHAYKNRINTNTSGLEMAEKLSWSNATDTLIQCISK